MYRLRSARLPITAKVVLLIGGLGVVSATANWFCLSSLHDADIVNATITQQVEPARVTLTEAKIAVGWMGLATYKMAGTSDPDTVHEANDERAGQYAAAKAWLNSASNSLQSHQEDVDGMLKRLDLINTIANSVHDMTAAGDTDGARRTLEFKFDPALVDATTSVNRLIDILGGESRTALEAAAESKAWTYKILQAVLIGGTIATVIAAMLLAHRTIARPLQRLAGVMRQIAQNGFDVAIDGLNRGDEVGIMAQAVLVFRDNGVALGEAQQQRARAGAGRR
jgi:methyl-accepting chemotaxis protein